MAVARDERDEGHAMREVSCRRCGTPVLVRKNSLAQTSIQWSTDPGESCPELAGLRTPDRPTGRLEACTSLRATIDDAVAAGLLPVGDE